ncbi:MurR/RpiR family transcriptional regulator [Amycolatopsis acidicola]|uniref:MurR/RpiR family transcriptional regulator n=1 Tax=Amycolatopsis acidicola TaxID=2596893 RepID=A0A5N0V0V4_9PSEU|nr:MurR/RpiR family transcriptional regulator [Amycolatopsis acidicola]KAA9160097.1 MurR/RpiR family transcriptional regulator [Amycolatopsis acidicola]
MDQQTGSALGRIRAALPSLIPSERRVGDVIVDHAADVIDWSVADLAALAGTSTATAVRACQHLGFSGFRQLRLQLVRDGAEAPQPCESFFAMAAACVADGESALDRESFARAARALARARRVLFVGNGESAFLAQAAAFRFTMTGTTVQVPTETVSQQAIACRLGARDVCVAISYSGDTDATIRAATAARTAGARTVVVTAFSHSPLAELADLLLLSGATASGRERDIAAGRITQLALLHALHEAARPSV